MGDNNYHLSKEQNQPRYYQQDLNELFMFCTESHSSISSPVSPMPTSVFHQPSLISATNFDLEFNNYLYEPQTWTTPEQPLDTSLYLFEPTQQELATPSADFNTLFPQHAMYFESTCRPKFTSASLSPNEVSLSSPVLNKRKRRASTTAIASRQPTLTSYQQQPRESKHPIKRAKIDATEPSPPTIDQLEKELAFLNDDCATILMMLDSLRNAFQTTDRVSSMGTAILDFSTEKRRGKGAVRNPDMEREMRIAYDDLMMQVRQLEKKVEKLEDKSRSMHLEEKKK